MYCRDALTTKISFRDFWDKQKYDFSFARDNPDYFYPDGVIVFTGSQGSGKTLSAVRYLDNLCKLYPKAILVSNCQLSLPHYSGDVLPYDGIPHLSSLDNGVYGIICFIDEIQTEFSSLESARLHPSTISLISMQRKRRLHIVGRLDERNAQHLKTSVTAIIFERRHKHSIGMQGDDTFLQGLHSVATIGDGALLQAPLYRIDTHIPRVAYTFDDCRLSQTHQELAVGSSGDNGASVRLPYVVAVQNLALAPWIFDFHMHMRRITYSGEERGMAERDGIARCSMAPHGLPACAGHRKEPQDAHYTPKSVTSEISHHI